MRDWYSEARAIMEGQPHAPAMERQHLIALQEVINSVANTSRLLNLALLAKMFQTNQPEFVFDPPLRRFVQQAMNRGQIDLQLQDKQSGALKVVLLRQPGVEPTPTTVN